MTFKITKKGINNFWHTYNNNSKVVNLSDFEVVLDYASQTFSISMPNGANVPNIAVAVADIIVLDETGANVNEIFSNVEALRVRLVALGYTPYIISSGGGIQSIQEGTNITVDNTDPLNPIVSATGGGGGGIPDAPNDANAYVRSALAWVIGYTKSAIDTLLGNKVDKITPITGATKTKITYNTQGQVTSGADATTDDIADSVNKRYQTDAQRTTNDATSSIQTQFNGKVNNTGTETIAGAKTFSSLLTMPSTGTPRILQVESSGQISGLDLAIYPSLTELALVKGVIGSAIQTQIDLRQPYAIARTTTVISFDVPAIYNSFSSPQTGTLTSSLTGARIGVVQVIYLNVATFPTLTGWVNIGSRAFQASAVNIIYAKWSEGSRVEYWISKAT